MRNLNSLGNFHQLSQIIMWTIIAIAIFVLSLDLSSIIMVGAIFIYFAHDNHNAASDITAANIVVMIVTLAIIAKAFI